MREPEVRLGPLTAAGREAADRLRTRAAIAVTITNARLDRKWTQEQLAQAAGTRQSRVAELESCTQGNPTLCTIEQVAKVLGLELILAPSKERGALKPVAATRERSPAYRVARKRKSGSSGQR